MTEQLLFKFILFVLLACPSYVQSKTGEPKDAADRQFPWLVGMNITSQDGSHQFCAGSIIKNNWILSTATCVFGAVKAEIFLARTDMSSSSGFIAVADKFIVNTDFNTDELYADVALIKLKTELCFNKNIKSIKVEQVPNPRMTLEVVTVPGWGMVTENLQGYNNSKLQYLDLFMISREECSPHYKEKISDKEFCTETALDNSPCHTSFGSPAIVNYGKEDELLGMFSYFGKTCEGGRPMGFVDVRKFVDWIEDKTK